MNLADLCPDGLDKYAMFLKQREAYKKFERVHLLLLMIHMHQKFREHRQKCELGCGGQDGDRFK